MRGLVTIDSLLLAIVTGGVARPLPGWWGSPTATSFATSRSSCRRSCTSASPFETLGRMMPTLGSRTGLVPSIGSIVLLGCLYWSGCHVD